VSSAAAAREGIGSVAEQEPPYSKIAGCGKSHRPRRFRRERAGEQIFGSGAPEFTMG